MNFKFRVFLIWSYILDSWDTVGRENMPTSPHVSLMVIVLPPVEVKTFCVDAGILRAFDIWVVGSCEEK